ncbi:hypothetical protein SAMN04487910_4137 [Aquimarina amphilecti]|uniref:Uncharacterized protein n=1 Tax=Aquimarina amphilecti TaxID=1038014 RepID=A0A1H7VPN0_AQUAM|nr:hypothetical protein SAMN04487910_4137 [Aquimarina amphilecti]
MILYKKEMLPKPQMKTKVILRTKKIDTNYVFSENNQVYLKRKSSIKPTNSNTLYTEEWFPISFCWKS